jgi:hypothetical protein
VNVPCEGCPQSNGIAMSVECLMDQSGTQALITGVIVIEWEWDVAIT